MTTPLILKRHLTVSPRQLVTLSKSTVIAVAFISACGCGGGTAPAPLWIGHIANLSGPDKQAGEAAGRGIRLAVEEIDKDVDQGVGRPFKVIHSDAQGALKGWEAEAVRLAAVNRVWFLLGGQTADEAERLDRGGVPVLSPSGGRKGLGEGIFCTGLSPAQIGKVLAQFAAQELGLTSVIVISDERQGDSANAAESFVRDFPAAWTKKDAKSAPVTRRLRWTKDTAASALAAAVQKDFEDGNCKAVVFAGPADGLRELGPLPMAILFAGADGSGSALAAIRAPFQEMYHVTAFVANAEVEDAAPRAVEFAKRYKQAFQEEADVHAALAYEGMKLGYEATLRAKENLTLARIREELMKLKDLPGLMGPLSFTPERQLRRPAFVMRIADGGLKSVKRYNPDGI